MKRMILPILMALICVLAMPACRLEEETLAVSPSPHVTDTVAPAPTPAPTLTPTAVPTEALTASPSPTPTVSPTPEPTYAPPQISFDGQHVDIGSGWITVDLPEGFEPSSRTNSALFRADYVGSIKDGIYSMEIIQAYHSSPTAHTMVRRLDEYLAHIQYQDATVIRLDDLTFGSAEGYHSVVEGLYQGEPITCHMVVAMSDVSTTVLYLYGTSVGLLSDDSWLEPIIQSFSIDKAQEQASYQGRYIAYDEEASILKSEFAPCQITLPEGWHESPTNRFLDSYIVMAGEHTDGNKTFNVYQYYNDANAYGAMDIAMEQYMIADRMIALSNNHLINYETELTQLPSDDGDNPRIHYLLRPSEEFVIALAIIEGEETSYILELWSYATDLMGEEAILELVNTFILDADALPMQNT